MEFLKAILELAKEVVEAENETAPEQDRDKAKEALTELFREAKNKNTHIIVERIVADIDEIVKKVRFPDWQYTSQGERSSNTNCTLTKSFLTKPTPTSGNTPEVSSWTAPFSHSWTRLS